MGAIKFNLLQNSHIENYLSSLKSIDFMEFADYCVNKYKSRGIEIYENRRRSYDAFKNAMKHFNKFQNSIGQRFETKDLDAEMLEHFSEYLQEEHNYAAGTVYAIITKIKFILGKAYKFNIRVDDSYEDFKMKLHKSYKVSLTEFEIKSLAFFENISDRQKEIRDMFILCAQSSLRYSDAVRLCRDHIDLSKMQINMISQKTKQPLCIPIDDYIKKILERYDYKCPPARSIQHYNFEIKNIAEIAGLTREIKYEVVRSSNIEKISTRLCDEIASHTARRTFVTEKIRLGWSDTAIRKCTGHTTIEMVNLYDKTDNSKYMQRYAY